jgi:hypothetical protein
MKLKKKRQSKNKAAKDDEGKKQMKNDKEREI